MYPNNDIHFISEPITLCWAGWRTDTAELTKHGWEISASQDVYRDTMQIAIRLRHEEHTIAQGVTRMETFHYRDPYYRGAPKSINIQFLGAQVIATEMASLSTFSPVDAWPSMDMTMRRGNLEDLIHFKKINIDTKEILLKEATMQEVLAFAMSKQETRQAEIRKEMLKRKELEHYRAASDLQAELRLVI